MRELDPDAFFRERDEIHYLFVADSVSDLSRSARWKAEMQRRRRELARKYFVLRSLQKAIQCAMDLAARWHENRYTRVQQIILI